MVEGSFSLEQVRYFCLQHGIIPLHNHNYHGRLYVVCPDAGWREKIAEVAYEEATGRIHAKGVSHHKLYLNYGKALGLSREEMLTADYCGGGLAFKSFFQELCGRNFLEGVSTHMLAGEAPIPGLYIRVARKLQEKFGTKVQLRYRQGKGSVDIRFFNDDDLERILKIAGITVD